MRRVALQLPRPVKPAGQALPPIQASPTLLHACVMLVLWRRRARTEGAADETAPKGVFWLGKKKLHFAPTRKARLIISDPSGRELSALSPCHRHAQGLKTGHRQGIVLTEEMMRSAACFVLSLLWWFIPVPFLPQLLPLRLLPPSGRPTQSRQEQTRRTRILCGDLPWGCPGVIQHAVFLC